VAQAELIPFLRIVEHIKQLCAQRRSGTVFLVSDDNRMAQVQLDNGEIASLLCRNRRGLEALGIMRGMQQARLRFDDSYLAKTERDDLSTQAVLDSLGAGASDTPAPATTTAPPGAVAAAPKVPAAAPALALTAEIKGSFLRVLVKYIGPMAEIVCEEHFEQAGNLRALILLLAGEIPNPDQAAKFRADISAELGLAP
jgi:hypothetical protein